MFEKIKSFRSKKYRDFVADHPCIDCGITGNTVVAHHFGKHGTGQKVSDLQTIPVCTDCHRKIHNGNGWLDDNEMAREALKLINEWLVKYVAQCHLML